MSIASCSSCDWGGDRPEGGSSGGGRLCWRVEAGGVSSSEGNIASSSDDDELPSMWLSSGSVRVSFLLDRRS